MAADTNTLRAYASGPRKRPARIQTGVPAYRRRSEIRFWPPVKLPFVDQRNAWRPGARGRDLRSLRTELLAVDFNAHLRWIEGEAVMNRVGLAERRRIGPGRVLDAFAFDLDMPVPGLALVRALRHLLAAGQKLGPNRLGRQTEAGRKAGFEED